MPTHLTVRAKGLALVQDLEALESNPPIRRYIGRKADHSVQEGGLAFVPVDAPVKVPNRHEYRRKVVEGSLEACDAETLEACGLKFIADAAIEATPVSKKGSY